MVTTTQIPPPRMQVVDPRTGLITREWYLWFINLYNLTGEGSNPISLEDLQVGPPDTAYLDDMAALQGDVPDNPTGYAEIDAKFDNLSMTLLSAPPTLGGSVTSVDASGGATGLSFSGGPITSMGTLTLSGTLVVSNGGTGATTLTGYVKGNGTSPFTASATIPAADVAGVALTKTDDANVTLTLGGSPTAALVAATSLTLGWTGTLSVARGGTGGGAASGTLLDNITGFASTGHLVRTGAGAYAFRTATGTANRIDVTNGSGVSGNPTFDISASYVGQASITTLGTITTGTWSATTIAANKGGTGLTSYTTGDILYASSSSALSALADVATGNALISGGVSVAPSWGKVGLTTHISGTLAVGNGGTGATTLTSGYLVKGNGSSAVSASVIYDDGTNIGIGNSSPAAKVDVSGNVCVSAGGYFYTPYNGATNTGTVRAGIQVDGTNQTLNFYTANSFRGAVEQNGNFYAGSGATGMTNGFFYIPAAAGAPTGVPTSISGRVPMYYDTTNNNFYIYNGAWKKVLLS